MAGISRRKMGTESLRITDTTGVKAVRVVAAMVRCAGIVAETGYWAGEAWHFFPNLRCFFESS